MTKDQCRLVDLGFELTLRQDNDDKWNDKWSRSVKFSANQDGTHDIQLTVAYKDYSSELSGSVDISFEQTKKLASYLNYWIAEKEKKE